MVKGKINVLAGGVIAGRGGKPVQVALSERSTAREVISVILKKYGLEYDPFDYQVWVVCPHQPGEPHDPCALRHSIVRLQIRPVVICLLLLFIRHVLLLFNYPACDVSIVGWRYCDNWF